MGRGGRGPVQTTVLTTVLTAVLGALAVLLVAVGAAPASAAFPGGNGLILVNRGGDLFTVDADGDDLRRLTAVGGISGAKWSPDGSRIAYRRAGRILVRDEATGRTVRVAGDVASAPEWSPDGRTIAFVKELPGAPCGEQAVYTVAASGGTPRKAYDPQSDNCPHGTDRLGLGSFSPEGDSILLTVCYGYYDDRCTIREVGLDGTNSSRDVTSLLCTMESEYLGSCDFDLHLSEARFSPDGRRVAFTGKGGYDGAGTLPGGTPTPGPGGSERLYVVGRDGTGLQVVSTAAHAVNPTWSPDGSTLVFTSRAADGVKSVMRVRGLQASQTPVVVVRDTSQPDWQPLP